MALEIQQLLDSSWMFRASYLNLEGIDSTDSSTQSWDHLT